MIEVNFNLKTLVGGYSRTFNLRPKRTNPGVCGAGYERWEQASRLVTEVTELCRLCSGSLNRDLGKGGTMFITLTC